MLLRPGWLLLLTLIAAQLPAAVGDGTVQAGYQAFQQQDYARALELWTPAAEQGDLRAQFYLSVLYERGLGVARDDRIALSLLRSSGEGGFAPAQYNLGNRYLQGQGVAQDSREAARWWMLAARRGFSRAQFNLGLLYSLGKGVEEDRAKAIYWYRRAAASGSVRALDSLKRMNVSPELPDPLNELVESGVQVSSSGRLESTLPTIDSSSQVAASDAPVVQMRRPDALLEPADGKRVAGEQDWIDQQPVGNFTVQLFSGSTREGAEAFRNKLSLPWSSAIFRYRVKGSDRVAVVTGSFPDHASASRAIRQLDPRLAENGPWVRSFSAIRQVRIDSSSRQYEMVTP